MYFLATSFSADFPVLVLAIISARVLTTLRYSDVTTRLISSRGTYVKEICKLCAYITEHISRNIIIISSVHISSAQVLGTTELIYKHLLRSVSELNT